MVSTRLGPEANLDRKKFNYRRKTGDHLTDVELHHWPDSMPACLARTRTPGPVSKSKRQRKPTAAELFGANQYRVQVESRGNARSSPPHGTYTAAALGRQQAKDGRSPTWSWTWAGASRPSRLPRWRMA